jgi:GGDEF domain-containing protein
VIGRRQADRRRSDRRQADRRGLRLPEKLALVGFALIGFWPGEPWSAAHVTLVVMCLLPLGVRSLLQWEDLLEAEPAALPVTSEEALARSVHALDNVAVPLAIIEAGPDGGIVREANPAMVDLLGLDPSGQLWWYLVSPADRVAVARAITLMLAGHTRAWRGLARHLPPPTCSDDAPTWLRLQLIALPTRRGEPARLSVQASPAAAPLRVGHPSQTSPASQPAQAPAVATAVVPAPRRGEAPAARPAAILASLPDLGELTERLSSLLAQAAEPETALAVVHCAVDVGRPTTTQATEAVLAAVATRLLDSCRPGDLVARGDGDSLVVVRPGPAAADTRTDTPDDAALLHRRLTTALAAPLAVQDSVRTVPVQLGLARGGPRHDAADLLAQAARQAHATQQAAASTPVEP